MNQDIDIKKQKARLALIMKTSNLRLWFYDPTTRHFCYLSEEGEYEREYIPADFAKFFHRDDVDKMSYEVFAICEGKIDTAKVNARSRAKNESDCRHYEITFSVPAWLWPMSAQPSITSRPVATRAVHSSSQVSARADWQW